MKPKSSIFWPSMTFPRTDKQEGYSWMMSQSPIPAKPSASFICPRKGTVRCGAFDELYIEWPECWYPDDSPWLWSGSWLGMGNCSWSGDDPTLEIQFICTDPSTWLLSAVVMSWMLDLFLSFFPEVCRRKYFWAWLATWVGVLVTTTFLEMLLQSPFP